MSKSVIIVGAGFSGLSAAMYLAKQGMEVNVFEKNATAGGRARSFEEKGFTFDMGPSWYWMPDVFERFFSDFGKNVSDYYDLIRLNPAYRVFFDIDDYIDIPGTLDETFQLFNTYEKNGATKLQRFLKDAKTKYEVGIGNYIYKPGKSALEYANISLLIKLLTKNSLRSLSKSIRKYFNDPRLIKILEFPVLFLGASAQKTPSLYSLMNYADLALGTWYPKGGFYKVVEAQLQLAKELGVSIYYNAEVSSFEVIDKKVACAEVNKKSFFGDYYVASADYHHVDNDLLGKNNRNYSEKYWDKRSLAPSAILIYLGLDTKLENLEHHNLFFDIDFDKHAGQIYDEPKWPSDPAIYVSCSSKSDLTVAPIGCENVVILIPVAPNLADNGKIRDHFYQLAIDKLEKYTKQNIRDKILFHRVYAHTDFIHDYNSYKGNAYGLSNTLRQTGFLRPSINHKILKNFFYTGQLTVPGPGVPPSLVSGKIVASEILQKNN